jgi:DNA ligase-1
LQQFLQLYDDLDQTTRTTEKVAALVRYFQQAEPLDAAWALTLLMGRKIPRAVKISALRVWASEVSGLPEWLIEECYQSVGDTAETLALILPVQQQSSTLSLCELIQERILELKQLSSSEQAALVKQTWAELTPRQIFLWHKLLLGGFRVGVARLLVARALGEIANVPSQVMLHRLLSLSEPTTTTLAKLLSTEQSQEPGQPYPFYLASTLEQTLDELGSIEQWQIEWKWDGIRAQLIRRQGQTMLWTRGEELVTDRYPEITSAAQLLPDGTVLDGEILAWHQGQPLPFQILQQRIARKQVSKQLLATAPVIFLAYDILEQDSQDQREQTLSTRRTRLEEMLTPEFCAKQTGIALAPVITVQDWQQCTQLREAARTQLCEGLMLKQRDSVYGVGRQRGSWWKWKSTPLTIDAVLIAAQPGHGRRANLFTDYTFAVWHEGELLPVAKAYSGLSDAEIKQVDAFVRANTTGRFGPVRSVTPELVFELHFEGVQRSTRHKSGVAVRFPRIARPRPDKPFAEADTLEQLLRLAPAEVPVLQSPKQKPAIKSSLKIDPRQQWLFE